MKLIVGLGNPGIEYEGTRHNAGFLFLDSLACAPEVAPVGQCLNFNFEKKFEANIAAADYKGEKLILVKPATFMNLSGQAVLKIMQFYKAETKDLIVVSDDVDLPLGTARIRAGGESGGQKGLQNIIDTLKTDNFLRIRIGISGDQPRIDTSDYVLAKFSPAERERAGQIIDEAIKYLLLHLGQKHEVPAHTIEI